MSERFAFSGPGVRYFPGAIPCPLAGVGSRGAGMSNRLALDDDAAQATFDPLTRRLVIRHARSCPRKTIVGDLILLGTGQTLDGREVPLAFHTRFDKTGDRFRAQPHLHPSVAAPLAAARCEPLEVVLDNGRKETVVVDSARLAAAWREPPLSDRLGRALIQVREDRSAPGASLVDLRVSIGLGPLSKPAVRVQVLAGESAASFPPNGATLGNLFGSGSWEFRLAALMRLPSAEQHVRRALFLMGLGEQPLLRRLAREGLRKDETLSFIFGGGRGRVRLGDEEEEIAGAADVARAYLEFDFVGAILAQRIRERLAAPVAGRREREELLVI